ncbi:MAG: TSUP family transporter, partial [Pseudobdellovibrio sp.]
MDSASLLFFTLAFFSEMLGTITGFGSSLFFVPLAGLLFDLKTTLALTALLHILSTTAQLLAFRHEMRWRLIWTMGIPSLFFVIIGAALSSVKQFKYAELVMGLF